MIKNKTEHIENDFKLINEKYYLYDKSKDLKRRKIKSANPNKFENKNNIKKFYLSKSDNKRHNNNNTFLYGKKQLKYNIKNISFQKIFNLIEQMNKTSRDNYFPKILKMPKNINNNNSNENRYFHFLKKNKTNYSIQNENNKSNNNIIYFRTIISSFNKVNNSKNNFNNNMDNNRNMNKTHTNKFLSSNKVCTTSNCCDASTNTNIENGFMKNKIINYHLNVNHNNKDYNTSNSKKRKRPLMIDYFYSEHKKFCYGFDKLRGKNKLKRPLFIVHKY